MRDESLMLPHVLLREERKEEGGPKARIWESDWHASSHSAISDAGPQFPLLPYRSSHPVLYI